MAGAYQQSEPYPPRNDAAFRDWLLSFSTLVAATAGRYRLDTACQAAQAPSTRTSNVVSQNDAISAVGP